MRRYIGIQLSTRKIGQEGFQPTNHKPLPTIKGISLDTNLPPGTRMMFANTSGCPAGWTKVTGVDGYHLQVGDVDNASDKTEPVSKAHSHTHSWSEGGGSINYQSSSTESETPTLTYPAIKYLMCEKQ